MRRFILAGLLPCLALGCVEVDFKLREPPARPETPVSAISTPITAEQVTPANARQMARALWDEFDHEEQATVPWGHRNRNEEGR
jgi:hypothetical protein